MPKISVIVPVYNASLYIEKCITSILSNEFEDFELLLIDDGSTDTSGKICDEYANKDTRIRVFHKENKGVSSARNLGIIMSKSEWITFIDSDDWVSENFLGKLYTLENVDFVASYYKGVGWNEWVSKPYSNALFSSDEMPQGISQYLFHFNTVWSKLFKKEIIVKYNIVFNEDLNYGEDTCFVFNYFLYINSFKTLSNVDYYYYASSNGLSKKLYSIDNHLCLVDNICFWVEKIEAKYNFCLKEYLVSFIRDLFYSYCWCFRALSFKECIGMLSQLFKNTNMKKYMFDSGIPDKTLYRKLLNIFLHKKEFIVATFLMKLKFFIKS